MERFGRNATDENRRRSRGFLGLWGCGVGGSGAGAGTGAGTVLAAVLLAAVVGASGAAGQPLFPAPFVVEHQIVQSDPYGSVFDGEPVTDYYHGSRIISVRPDGTRLVVDFSERQLTEIRPDHQTYAVLSFGRFAELTARLRSLDAGTMAAAGEEDEAALKAGAAAAEPEFRFQELPAAGTPKAVDSELTARPGVRRLRVTLPATGGEGSGPAVEVWLDPSVRLGSAALTALERFEDEVLGAREVKGGVAFSRYVTAARKHAGGAFPVRTLRPTVVTEEVTEVGTVEDVASRLESLASVPQELLTVPEGYRRVAHPLEQMVVFAEEEAELRELMSAREPEGP